MGNLELVTETEPVPTFLDYLFEGLTGYVDAPVLDRETNKFYPHFFKWPSERQDLIDWILAHSPEKDVYITPAVFSAAHLSRDTFKESNVVWTEFDGNVPATEGLGSIPVPTLQVRSSNIGFEHWYWKLESPISQVTEIEAVNRGISYSLGADASSWDATQILRIPGTINHKRGTKVFVSSQVKSTTGIRASAFKSIEYVPSEEYNFTPDVIPDVSEVVLSYAFPSGALKLYRTQEFPVGERSSALMKLGYYLAEMGLSDAEMFSVLRNADDRWKKFAGRQDRDKRLGDIIAKARIKYAAVVDVSEPNEQLQIYGWKALLESEIHIEWLIPDLLQNEGYFLLTGPSGVGKTQWSLQWAIHLALGKKFLGFEFSRQYRVVIMSLEMGHADVKYFMEQMSKNLTPNELEILDQNIFIVPVGEPIYLDSPAGQKQLESILDLVKPDIFMWDSIGSSSTGDISSETTVKTLMGFNDKIRQKYKVASWYIHHNRKATADNKKPNKLPDVYGNQYLTNRATTVYCLWPLGDNQIEVIPLKKRMAPLEKPWSVKRVENLNFEQQSLLGIASESASNVLDFKNKEEVTDEDLEGPKPNQNGGGLEL